MTVMIVSAMSLAKIFTTGFYNNITQPITVIAYLH